MVARLASAILLIHFSPAKVQSDYQFWGFREVKGATLPTKREYEAWHLRKSRKYRPWHLTSFSKRMARPVSSSGTLFLEYETRIRSMLSWPS